MRPASILFIISGVAYLALGVSIFVRQRGTLQRLYGFLCFVTCLWQGVWAILLSVLPEPRAYFWTRVCFSGIVLVPAVFYHFISELTQEAGETLAVKITYGLGILMVTAIWIGNIFINGFNRYSWGFSARAGLLYPLFVLVVTAVIGRTFFLLMRMEAAPMTSATKKKEMHLAKAAALVYCGGALDLLPQYGIPIFPLSFIFLGGAIVLFAYAIWRYEFLAISTPAESKEDAVRRLAASEEMKRMGMAAAFPLVSQGELLGYLLLGEKMSEESYSKEDLLLLRIVANQAALAYQRVRYLEMAVHGARTEMLGEIAGGFAHEIKTPLANISLPAELSLMDLDDLETGKRTMEEVIPEIKLRLREIMQQTLKASEKIEAVRQFSKPGQIRLESVRLGDVLFNSLSLLDHLLKKKGIQVRTEFPPTLPYVRGDAKQLEIVFVNLIKNAAEAMGQNPSAGLARELWLKGRQEGEWVMATVKDSGPGIKRTDFGHLFEAYFTTKGSDGTGMGLFLSQQVIKAHGGSIDVRSEEGKGTEFIIRLPKVADQTGIHQAA